MTIPQQLKSLRLKAGFTQSELAQQLGNGGYTKHVISYIESGKRNVDLNLIEQWATACNHTLELNFTEFTNFK